MLSFFAQIGFLNPWALTALAALPALWYILRVMPPAPRRILFAPLHFLKDLQAVAKTPSHTPWWILLLRLLILTCLIFAFAKPVFRLDTQPPEKTPLLVIFENGWDAAPNWTKAKAQARQAITKTTRTGAPVYILKTAPAETSGQTRIEGPFDEGRALSFLDTIEPYPWPSDFQAAAQALEEFSPPEKPQTLWIGTGGFTNLPNIFLTRLERKTKNITYMSCAPEDCAILLRPGEENTEFTIEQMEPAKAPRNMTLSLYDGNNRLLHEENIKLSQKRTEITPDMSPAIQKDIRRVQIDPQNHAGTVLYLQAAAQRKHIGLVSNISLEETKPFLDGLFYLNKALSPTSDLETAPLGELLTNESGFDVLITQGALSNTEETLQSLENWIQDGGLLLRFGAADMDQAAQENRFTPVPLRPRQRALDGDLSWEDPRKLKNFIEGAPLGTLRLNDTVTVRRQILADPSSSLEGKIWAQLEDGTPLITADTRGAGMIVFIHTSAAPDWSNLPLSGVYVHILNRIIQLAGNPSRDVSTSGDLTLERILDSTGTLRRTNASITLPESALDDFTFGPDMPPGIYTQGAQSIPMMLGAHLPSLKPAQALLPASITIRTFEKNLEQDLGRLFLLSAFILFLIDWIILLLLSGSLFPALRKLSAAFLLGVIFMIPTHSHADDLTHANGLHLAFISSGQSAIDTTAQRGLENLGRALEERTSIEIKGVAGINPARDELSFFPFVYWPLPENPRSLNDAAIENIRAYLAYGGTLVIDLRNGNAQASRDARTLFLRNLSEQLSLPALAPLPEDHVLHKTFYLLEDFPGAYRSSDLWGDVNAVGARDGVSSILITGNDFARAWADLRTSGGLNPILRGASRQQEMALRSGINIMMYSLTGTYKADQVHIPHILKRLGE